MSARKEIPGGSALAPESVVFLEVDGVRVVTWNCTPTDLRALAAGWLVAEGIATGLDDILELRESSSASATGVEARLSEPATARRPSPWGRSAFSPTANGSRSRAPVDSFSSRLSPSGSLSPAAARSS